VQNALDKKHVYCVGIGGIGVSGLAELLHHHDIRVSGADLTPNAQTNRLKSLDVMIYDNHAKTNLQNDVDLLVYSSAVTMDNPERQAANERGIPQITRGQLLADCSQGYRNIFIAGTHGKTTTSGLMSWVFEQARQDPTFMIGGVLRDRDSTMRAGQSDVFIAESDESDASFLLLSPTVAVVTNIEADHMETYDHDFNKLIDSFLMFMRKVPLNGCVVICIDNPVLRALLPKIDRKVITYGESLDADYCLKDFSQQGLQSHFHCNGVDVVLNLGGKHNALNALAVMAVSDQFGIQKERVFGALRTFPGMRRRMHPRGEMLLAQGSVLVFDDYGHHPTELEVTFKAAKNAFPDRRIVMVFQPHRYTRTRDLMKEFVNVLKEVDCLVLTEVYAASEERIIGADGVALLEAVAQEKQTELTFVPTLSALPLHLQHVLRPNDILILQGAGNIVTMATTLTAGK